VCFSPCVYPLAAFSRTRRVDRAPSLEVDSARNGDPVATSNAERAGFPWDSSEGLILHEDLLDFGLRALFGLGPRNRDLLHDQITSRLEHFFLAE